MDNIDKTLSKELLFSLFSQEKDLYSQYLQLCAIYQTQPDPLVTARHQGKLEILQHLLREKGIKI
jgi:hypothetical protein